MSADDAPDPSRPISNVPRSSAGQAIGPLGVVAEAPDGPPEPQTRDAQGLTPALASVRSVLRQEGAQPVDTAPRDASAPIFLFCPDQGGWQAGWWRTGCEPDCWVATLDGRTVLRPTHWLEAPPAPPA